MSISTNMIGIAGEYYVCAELCRCNILALVTPKNNPLFDIMATDPYGKRLVTIQVKTMSMTNKKGWNFGTKDFEKKENENAFLILVKLNSDGTNDFYIYKYDDFVDRNKEVYDAYMNQLKPDGSRRKDTDFRWFDLVELNEADKARKNNWSLLGFTTPPTPVK